MKFYISSRLGNSEEVRELARDLALAGMRHTYDWTTHGATGAEPTGTLSLIAKNELDGIIESDLYIAVLPGGNGSHVEIGMALAAAVLQNKPKVILWAKSKEDMTCYGKVPSFYYHPQVEFVLGDKDKLKERIAAITGHRID